MKIWSVLLGVAGGLLMLIGVLFLLDGHVPVSLDGFQAWSHSSLMLGGALTIGGAILVHAGAVLAAAGFGDRRVTPPLPPYTGMPPQS